MTALPDDVRAQLRLAYARTGAFFRTGAWLIAGLGALCTVGGSVRGLWWLSVISLVFFGGLAVLGSRLARRYAAPESSPVLHAVLEQPERVARIRVASTSASSYLQIRLVDGQHLALRIPDEEIDRVRFALGDRSPAAELIPPPDVPAARQVR